MGISSLRGITVRRQSQIGTASIASSYGVLLSISNNSGELKSLKNTYSNGINIKITVDGNVLYNSSMSYNTYMNSALINVIESTDCSIYFLNSLLIENVTPFASLKYHVVLEV